MGCGSSKLETTEDSIHVILAAEKKKQEEATGGETTIGYKPRQPHPKLQQAQSTESENFGSLDKLMFHAANHNDSVDKRDLQEYGGPENEEKA